MSHQALRAARDLGRLLELVLDGMAEPRAVVRSLGIDQETRLLASAWPLEEAARLCWRRARRERSSVTR